MIAIVGRDAVREATKLLLLSLGYSASTFGSAEEFLNSDKSTTHLASLLMCKCRG
jgi:FixJ family two-component response regulator